MAFQIDPSIPLQAQRTTFDPAAILMQAQQNAANLEKHRFEMQKLREDYDLAKEQRKQQKAMQIGIASDLARIQSGSPAQYAPMQFQQQPQQPKAYTGDLMGGDFQLGGNNDPMNGSYQLGGGEVTQEAVAGREPSYTEMLQIGFKNAMLAKDAESAFKYAAAIKQQQQADRELNAPIGNPYPVYDTQGNFVGTRIMTKTGQEVPFGQQGTTTVKPDVLTQKDKVLQDFQERKLRAEQDRAAKELALKERELTLKPDPVQKAIEIEIGKEKVKTESTAQAARREKLANANDGLPLIDNYINALKESPQTGAGETYEKVMGYVGLGSQKQQAAMAKAKQAGEALLTFAQKQPGPSTDRDVASYRAQMGVVTDSSLPAKARIAAAEQAKTLLLKIQAKYGNYQDGGQNQQQTNQTGGWKIERVK